METILFGFGRAGLIHYKNMLNHKDLKLSYVVDAVDISSKLEDGIRYVNVNDRQQLEQILSASKIKAVIIASPTKTHYELVMKSLSYHKHVFIEKPLVDELEQINNCFDLAEKNNLILSVGYNRRYDPTIQQIKSRIDAQEIGPVRYALTISRDYPYPEEKFLKICQKQS